MNARLSDEELFTMLSPPARKVLAANLAALMDAWPEYGTLPKLEAATSTRGGLKVSKTALGQIRNAKTAVNVDFIESIGKVFGLAPWQMLIPGLDPRNPQILRAIDERESDLYRRMGELAKQIVDLPAGGPNHDAI